MVHGKIEAILQGRICNYQKVWQQWINNFLPPDFDTTLSETLGPRDHKISLYDPVRMLLHSRKPTLPYPLSPPIFFFSNLCYPRNLFAPPKSWAMAGKRHSVLPLWTVESHLLNWFVYLLQMLSYLQYVSNLPYCLLQGDLVSNIFVVQLINKKENSLNKNKVRRQ